MKTYTVVNNSKLFPNNKDKVKGINQFSAFYEDNPRKAIPTYIKLFRENGIDFPYKRHNLSNEYPFECMSFFKTYKDRWNHKEYKVTDFKRGFYLPTDFYLIRDNTIYQAEPYMDLDSNSDIDIKYNQLTDYFAETARVKCNRFNKKSIRDGWYYDDRFLGECIKRSIFNYKQINPFTLREVMYTIKTYPECVHHKISFIHNILWLLFNGKPVRFFDPCAGFGDRLISAIAYDCETYLGVDPNTNMTPCFQDILNTFNSKYKVYEDYMPSADLKIEEKAQFNLVYVSPPSFDSEIYEVDGKGQSITEFSDRDEWLVNFLFKTFYRSWMLLEEDGYLIIQSILFEEICAYLLYRLPDAIFMGALSVKTASRNKPMWIFYKKNMKQLHKVPTKKECLKVFSNHVQAALKKKEDIQV